jgi:hypothetical protein
MNSIRAFVNEHPRIQTLIKIIGIAALVWSTYKMSK